MKRKILITFGILLVLLVAVVAALPYLLDVNQYRGRIQSALETRTGRQVSLGKMDLSIFPLAFRVENAVIGEAKGFPQTAPFVHIPELFVSAKLFPLLSGEVRVDSLELRRPRIELIRNRDSEWNFSTLGQPATTPPLAPAPPSTTPTAPAATPPAQPQGARLVALGSLKVIDGQIAITDLSKSQPRAIYDHIDLTVEGYAPNTSFPIELAAHLPGAGKQELSLKGTLGPISDGNLAATDFTGSLKLDEVSLAGLKKFASSAEMKGIDFVVSGSAEIKNQKGALSSNGRLTMNDGHVNGVTIGYPISADYKISADLNADLIKIETGTLKLGATPLSVVGTINTAPTPAQIDLNVSTSNVTIDEAARLASAFDVAFNPGMEVHGKLDANLNARGSASRPAMNGKISARELVMTGKGLPQAVQVTLVDLALSPAAIQSNEFVATTGSTAARVKFALGDYASDSPNIDASVRADGAQLGELLNIAKAAGIPAAEGLSGSGAVSLNVQAQGPLKKNAVLNYSGSGSLRNASLTLPAFTQPLKVGQADLRFTQSTALLDNVVFTIGSTNARGNLALKGLAPGATPELQFVLTADKWDVAEWKQLLSHPPVPAKQALAFDLVPNAWADTSPEPSLILRMVGSGSLDVSTVLYDKLLMNNAHSNVTLEHGIIKLEPFTAQLYGGTLNGTVVVDTHPNPPVYTVTSKLDHVDANQLLAAVADINKTVFGLLAANANTNFSATSSENIARNLNGGLHLDLKDGKIANLDLLYQLATIGKFIKPASTSQPFTNIAKMTGDFDVKNGVARTDNLNAAIDAGSLAAKGAINLAEQTLDLQVTAVLTKDFTQSVGGTQIGGYLTTALANSKGELIMPVLITGSLTNPRVAPDFKRLAQMKLESVLPGIGSSGGAAGGGLSGILGGILGGFKKPTKPEPPAPDAQKPPDSQKDDQSLNTTPSNVSGGSNPTAPKKTDQPANTTPSNVMGDDPKKPDSTKPKPPPNKPPPA